MYIVTLGSVIAQRFSTALVIAIYSCLVVKNIKLASYVVLFACMVTLKGEGHGKIDVDFIV